MAHLYQKLGQVRFLVFKCATFSRLAVKTCLIPPLTTFRHYRQLVFKAVLEERRSRSPDML
jgi:hypothetical protein